MQSFLRVIHDAIPFALAGLPALYAASKLHDLTITAAAPRAVVGEVELEIDRETAKRILTDVKRDVFPELQAIEELKGEVAALRRRCERADSDDSEDESEEE